MMGAAFGLVHAAIIDAAGVATSGAAAGWGVLLGGVHGVIILAAMPMLLSTMHPLVRIGEIDRPHVALTAFGRGTSMGSLAAHVVFGLVRGGVRKCRSAHLVATGPRRGGTIGPVVPPAHDC